MFRYIAHRLLLLVPLLFGTTVVVFAYVHIIPGDPIQSMLGVYSNPELVADLREDYKLDEPIVEQYTAWVGNVAHGDLGTTFRTQNDVRDLIGSRAGATLLLAAGGLIVGLGIAIPVGLLAGLHRGRPIDSVLSTLGLLGLAVPSFILGYALLQLFAVRLGWFPTSGYVPVATDPLDSIRHLVLPATTLGIAVAPFFIRVVRTEVIQVMHEPHVAYGRSKGLRQRWLTWRYVLRNVLPRIVVLLGLLVGGLLGGSVFVEEVYGWPGMGRLLVDSVVKREYFVVQGLILIYAVLFALVNLTAEVAQALLDPRVRATT